MIEHLRNNPDKHFYVNNQDEDQARLLLDELGMLGSFQGETPNAPGQDQIAIGECPSHFIVAMLFNTDPDRGKNGFLIFAVPKNQTPPDRMRAILRGIIADFGIPGFEVTPAMFSSPAK